MNENSTEEKTKFVEGKGILNLPNILTISRIVMIPIFVVFFYVHFTGHYFVAWAIFAIAAVTDLLDGYIARKHNLVTNLGKFLDPIADKVLVLTALIIFLTRPHIFLYNFGGSELNSATWRDVMSCASPGFESWPLIVAGCGVSLIIAREMIVSGLRMVAASSGCVIAADKIGKYKTFSQDLCIGFLVVAEGIYEIAESYLPEWHLFGEVVNYIGLGLFIISVILTVISGINYVVKNLDVLKK